MTSPRSDYQLEQVTTVVPPPKSLASFVTAFKNILRRKLVQEIRLSVTDMAFHWSYLKPVGLLDPHDLDSSIGDIAVYDALRLTPIVEFLPNTPSPDPSRVLLRILQLGMAHGAYPTACVVGVHSTLWDWLESADSSLALGSSEDPLILGMPIYQEVRIEDSHVFFCFGETPYAGLIDVHRTVKFIIPGSGGRSSTSVEFKGGAP